MERLTRKFLVPQTGEVLAYLLNSGVTDTRARNKLGAYEDAEEQGLLLKIGCHCKDCVHVDYAGCKGTTVYCMKHECYMQEDGFCNYAKAEVVLEKMREE